MKERQGQQRQGPLPISEGPVRIGELTGSTEQALKAEHRRLKFYTELQVWSTLHTGEIPQENMDAKLSHDMRRFGRFPREGQIVMHQDLHESNEHEITRRFKERIELMQRLLADNGQTPDLLQKARRITEKVFANKPHHLKAEEFKHMDSEIQHLFVVNFPKYLIEFTEIASFEDSREASVQARTTLVSRKFQRAETKAEKAMVSRELREGNRKWLADEFSAYLIRYEELTNASVIDSRRTGFIPLGTWQEKFREADFENRIDLLRVFRYVLSPYDDVELKQTSHVEASESPVKPQTDHEVFVEAITNGIVEDKDGLEEDVKRNLGIAVKEYERLLRSEGRSRKQAKELAIARGQAIFAEIFVDDDKSAFGAPDRPKDLSEALGFITSFVGKRSVSQSSA